MEFPGNSQNVVGSKKALPEKKVEKVVVGEVVQKKPPLGKRIKTIFFGGDFKVAAGYVAADVLLPALRNLIVDAITKGAEQLMYGDSPRRGRGYRDPRNSRISYNAPVQRSYRPSVREERHPLANRADMGEVILANKSDAESVLERMQDIADQYDVVSVADMYELLGLPTTHIDNKWGWSGLHDVKIRQVRDGFLVDLPPAEEI